MSTSDFSTAPTTTVRDAARRIATAPTASALAALLLTGLFFSLKTDRFLQTQNLSLVLQQVMVVGVLAIGQTLVILTAGIDLSVGTVMAFGQIVMTKMAVENGVNPLAAIALGIGACVAFGLLNGALVTGVRLPAFIVTLGTFNIAFALTHIYSNDLTFTGLPSEMLFFGRTFTIGGAEFTYGTVLMLLLYGVVWYALTQTAWGRHVYAVGDNPEAARLTGIKTNRRLAQRLRVRRPDVRHRGDAPRRPHGARRPERGADDGEPRQHHRGRPRRHQPVRRPREHHRNAHRRS